jgi:hypothetical protein
MECHSVFRELQTLREAMHEAEVTGHESGGMDQWCPDHRAFILSREVESLVSNEEPKAQK